MERMARAHVEEPAQARLGDGSIARVVPSRFAGGFELEVAGTPQSHVDLDDPTHLHFEYVARMAAVIDRLRMPGQPLTAIHLGGGALTLPRYLAHTRPGSRQQVIELEQPLIDLVRAELPLPRGAQVRVRIGDAREVAAKLPAGLQGAADLVVSDVFAGAQTPAHLTTLEYYRVLAGLLAPGGVLLVNVADGAGLAFARRQVATRAGGARRGDRARRGADPEGPALRESGDRGIHRPAPGRVAPPPHGRGAASGQGRPGR